SSRPCSAACPVAGPPRPTLGSFWGARKAGRAPAPMLARPASRRPWTGHLLSLLLILLACQRSPSPPPTPAAGPAPAASPPTAASAAPIPSPSPLRGLPVRDPFPAATTTVANGQALLWSPWAMEGRDPQD